MTQWGHFADDVVEPTHSDMEKSLHMNLLGRTPGEDDLDGMCAAPLFSYAVMEHADTLSVHPDKKPFSQYALLAGDNKVMKDMKSSDDPRIFFNVASPSSIFICGSQGSGKSHSLSCILESCLIPSGGLGRLPHPLTGVVFHYDPHVSDTGGSPCEAAYLSSDKSVKVRVLCPPTNISTIQDTYAQLDVKVEELRLDQKYLNTKRMLDLMAFSDHNTPLYMQVIQRILREMRIEQQRTRTGFNYAQFISMLDAESLTPEQRRPLQQRIDTLESFMNPLQVVKKPSGKGKKISSKSTKWRHEAGELLIVDLSCPCITAAMACALFNICLSIFLEQDSSAMGRVVALDEAHKYMGETAECETLTKNLLSTIRLQRHLGARVVISTQEPTISPRLLDLCSVTIVHRFASPDWLNVLAKHLAGISNVAQVSRALEEPKPSNVDVDVCSISKCGHNREGERKKKQTTLASFEGLLGVECTTDNPILELFSKIIKLKTGEALIFAPSAVLGLRKESLAGITTRTDYMQLAHNVLHVVVRDRLTADGGRSILAD